MSPQVLIDQILCFLTDVAVLLNSFQQIRGTNIGGHD